MLLWRMCSSILQVIDASDTGLYLAVTCRSPFVNSGETFASFFKLYLLVFSELSSLGTPSVSILISGIFGQELEHLFWYFSIFSQTETARSRYSYWLHCCCFERIHLCALNERYRLIHVLCFWYKTGISLNWICSLCLCLFFVFLFFLLFKNLKMS